MKTTPKKTSSDWQNTRYPNLLRYIPSGNYFARLRVRGKLIRKSLRTTDEMTAKRDLIKLEDRLRNQGVRNGKMTFGAALDEYQNRRKADPELKRRTLQYDKDRITALLKSWPEVRDLEVRKLTERQCEDWANAFKPGSSPGAFNHTLGLLRAVIDIAIKDGARYDNPAMIVARLGESHKKLELPEPAQFEKFISAIEASGSGWSKHCADLVRFLAFGGFRITEAKFVTWADVKLDLGKIIVRGEPDSGLKGRVAGDTREVPMIPEMRELLERLRAERPDEKESAVMRVHECQRAMDRAAKLAGMKRITHHDLRHLFATRCIESGVDIPTVSRWLGHKDGGALAMKVYGHLRDQHSTAMAQKVTFKQAENVISLQAQAV